MKNVKKKENGITLIALVITVLIMLILAGVAISALTADGGMFPKTQSAVEKYNNAVKLQDEKIATLTNEMNEYFNKYSNNGAVEEIEGINVNVENEDIYYIGKTLEFNSTNGIKNAFLNDKDIDNGYVINDVGTYTLTLVDNNLIKQSFKFYVNDGLLALIKDKNLNEGVQTVAVNDVAYNINLIKYDGDLVLDGVTTNNVSTLIESSKTYEVGSLNDVATSTEYAQNTVVLKVDGNLTINEGVTLTAVKSDAGYGGPKGMYLCVNGTITNNGTISMTARGAKAEGQDVYLWQNASGDYEYIPAVGSAGGKNNTLLLANSYNSTYSVYQRGVQGISGTDVIEGRALAGGAAGHAYFEGSVSGRVRGYTGNGADATSYSGGSGGGAIAYINSSASSAVTYYGASGGENGGAGGRGKAYDGNAGWHRYAGGGAGNPGGAGYYEGTSYPRINGSNGTGGLLIIFGKTVINKGTISSNGSNYNAISLNSPSVMYRGGASGAGSINIFYINNIDKGTIYVLGGNSDDAIRKGGNGSISVGKIIDGTYVE